jgi:hypothetical protein
MAVNGITGREERGDPHTTVKAKLEQLCSVRLIRHNQAVRLLDMQRLQVVKVHKPTASSFNHF